MRVVKINAIWCSGCLVMNKIWKNINKDNNINTLDLDYDMDEEEVSKYNVGDILHKEVPTRIDELISSLNT